MGRVHRRGGRAFVMGMDMIVRNGTCVWRDGRRRRSTPWSLQIEGRAICRQQGRLCSWAALTRSSAMLQWISKSESDPGLSCKSSKLRSRDIRELHICPRSLPLPLLRFLSLTHTIPLTTPLQILRARSRTVNVPVKLHLHRHGNSRGLQIQRRDPSFKCNTSSRNTSSLNRLSSITRRIRWTARFDGATYER
ncbi:hypothetical protein DOTSEDRAFT_53498 [Dothistroma septosporum NZE10]|uniref:Uncharacterized protein n=1 Tax=Dothistroma septosporum (strain NZE10 / CBS 128990) TaxID=675120 RepID=N1PPR9_DOTSN|nr:hypothetical protein DOTSEDRAFT_53498 [Dothistroma septosporum NZE10]